MKKQDTPAMNIVWRDISELTPYERNAKLHPDEQIDRIANSLEAFGWQQTLVIDNNGVIIVGHGRLLAAQKLTKQGKKKKYRWNNNEPFDWSKVPCKLAEDMTEDEIKAYRLADNKLNESPWDEALKEIELADIEMDMEQFGFELEQAFADAEEEQEENGYTNKTDIPQYEVTGESYSCSQLLDTQKTSELISEINESNISDEEKEFLKQAAARHLIFDYKKIAEYYAGATAEMQRLMEKSALVIVDYDNAIANGYAKLSKKLTEIREQDA
jgi:hypothetical protein